MNRGRVGGERRGKETDTFDTLAQRDMDDRHDAIVKSMWEDYQETCS
jgi:hypothetical protein